MPEGIKDKVAIIGMGCTKFGELWDEGADDLMVEAFQEALNDAGIEKKDIHPPLCLVMAGLVPAIHVFIIALLKSSMPGSSLGMTTESHGLTNSRWSSRRCRTSCRCRCAPE